MKSGGGTNPKLSSSTPTQTTHIDSHMVPTDAYAGNGDGDEGDADADANADADAGAHGDGDGGEGDGNDID
eukprot:4317763-Karenia_brevis.AAC.1